ncbi:MAG TPA: DUF4956 domain-containing protein [Candidatus Polarisedimenticolaceae bacterium]|nr:DUF4956 domain-containing protein [Candidatus Polarisedimenticolaceae bacterium]
MSRRRFTWDVPRLAILVVVALAFAAGIITEFSTRPEAPPPTEPQQQLSPKEGKAEKAEKERPPVTVKDDIVSEFASAAVRLPIAALLGTLLALRPRRQFAPRRPDVVQTQIVLAVVGAVIMLVVGASLARAFGIVGVASLVRYRSKIDDPKEAVVMLSALAVGLACGVGLFFLGIFSALFLVATLWVIESFEPMVRIFELAVKFGDKTAELRPQVEAILTRLAREYELRMSAADQLSYLVQTSARFNPAPATEALRKLAPDQNGSVEWVEKTKTK